jgi:RND family efflux transporter MFP subunit
VEDRSSLRRRIALLLAVVLAALLGAIVWRVVATRNNERGQTVIVRRGTLKATIETSGKLVARRVQSVSSPASGAVKLVAVHEGDVVRQGDVLVVLDDGPARNDVQQAERAVEAAETKVGVARQHAQSDPNALPDVAAAEQDATSARAALAAANARLAGTRILAPFAGVIVSLRVGEGSGYGAGSEALTIADPSDLYVTANIDEVDRPLVSAGQEAMVTVTAFPGTPLAGKIVALSSAAQTQGGSTIYPVQITFDPPKDPPLALLPGMTTDVHIVTNARNNVLILPSGAIRRAGDREYVVVRHAGQDEEVEIRTGARSGGDVEIASGLTEGETVVLH